MDEQPGVPMQNENAVEGYLDEEDMAENQDRMDEQHDDIENIEWADVPQQKKNEGLYQLFNKVLKSKDNSKVANLDKYELGPQVFMNVRNAQFLALLGSTVRHERFAQFFYSLGEITLKTSASKKGWFTELFISQKKQTTRASGAFLPEGSVETGQQFGQSGSGNLKRKKMNLFGAKGNENVE